MLILRELNPDQVSALPRYGYTALILPAIRITQPFSCDGRVYVIETPSVDNKTKYGRGAPYDDVL